MSSEDIEEIKAAILAAVKALGRLLRRLAGNVRRLITRLTNALEERLVRETEDFLEAHQMFARHADLIDVDGYLDRWYRGL